MQNVNVPIPHRHSLLKFSSEQVVDTRSFPHPNFVQIQNSTSSIMAAAATIASAENNNPNPVLPEDHHELQELFKRPSTTTKLQLLKTDRFLLGGTTPGITARSGNIAKVKQRSDYEVDMSRKKSLAQFSSVPCIYANCGCAELLPTSTWLQKDHFSVCHFRPIPCPLPSCPDKPIPYYDYIFHLQSHFLYPNYTPNLTSKIILRREDFEVDQTWSPKWLCCYGYHFFLHLTRSTPGIWSSWVAMYDNGGGVDPATFLARITYYKELRSVGGIYPVRSVRDCHGDDRGRCLLTGDGTMRDLSGMGGGGLLTDVSVHIEIVKYTSPYKKEEEASHGDRVGSRIGVTTSKVHTGRGWSESSLPGLEAAGEYVGEVAGGEPSMETNPSGNPIHAEQPTTPPAENHVHDENDSIPTQMDSSLLIQQLSKLGLWDEYCDQPEPASLNDLIRLELDGKEIEIGQASTAPSSTTNSWIMSMEELEEVELELDTLDEETLAVFRQLV